jgi:hypothetical protein
VGAAPKSTAPQSALSKSEPAPAAVAALLLLLLLLLVVAPKEKGSSLAAGRALRPKAALEGRAALLLAACGAFKAPGARRAVTAVDGKSVLARPA